MPSDNSRAPEMPALITATPCGARRLARKSGQRASIPRLALAPSVIESPRMATACAPGWRLHLNRTEQKARRGGLYAGARRRCARPASGPAGRSTPSRAHPSETWSTGLACGRWMLTVSRARSGTDRSTGSLTSGAPGATLAAGWPENVSVRRLPASMAEPDAASATVAAPMRSGTLPYAFDSTMRTRGPPTLRRATWRTVCPCSTAGTLLGNRKSLPHTACGLAVQLASQAEVRDRPPGRRSCSVPGSAGWRGRQRTIVAWRLASSRGMCA